MENIKKIKFKLFLCSFSFFIIYFGVAFSMLMIQPKTKNKLNFKVSENKSKIRGNIYDNNGYLIATTIRKHDLIVNPSVLRDPKRFELKLKKIFGNNINFNFKDKLFSNLKYLKVKKNISFRDYNEIP